MDPITLSAIVAGVSSLGKGIAGYAQKKKGEKMINSAVRPTYEIPVEISKALGVYQDSYNSDMPNYSANQDRIEQQSANSIKVLKEGGDTSRVGAILAGSNNMTSKLNEQNMSYRMNAQNNYAKALSMMAGYRDKKFDKNIFAPYVDKFREGRDIYGAGVKNMYGGLDQLGSMAAMVMSGGITGAQGKVSGNTSMSAESQNFLKLKSLLSKESPYDSAVGGGQYNDIG
jgi:hypothetical protein